MPNSIKRTLTFVADNGHEWLEVDNADVKTLGIAGQVSSFSYMTIRSSFLEGDSDAALFLKAAAAAGWEVVVKHRYVDGSAALRQYASFKPEWIETPIAVDASVWIKSSGEEAVVVSVFGRGVVIETLGGVKRRADSSIAASVLLNKLQWANDLRNQLNSETPDGSYARPSNN